MASQISEVVQNLRTAALRQDQAGLTDGQLLGRFIELREEAAAAALMGRHGPMVWGVCRRLLGHYDAEDAFQATFLVLVRKAASIVPRDMVANWLYGVAYQTAKKARAMRAKRQSRERQGTTMPEPQAPAQDTWNDLRQLLDEELSRLPDKYRAAIVLCDLEGKTHKEAAQQLGVPEGTLAGHLNRGRALLARRLTRRGLALSTGALTAVLSQEAASASVPASVMTSAIKAVTAVAAGQAATAGVVSVKAASLTEGVLKAMLLTKLKITTAGLLLTAVLGLGAGLIYKAWAAEKAPARRATETAGQGKQPAPNRDENRAKELASKAQQELQGVWEVVSVVHDGKPVMKIFLDGQVWVFDGDKIRGWGGSPTYKLDPSQKPKAIDVTHLTRVSNTEYGAAVTDLGIYELKDDELKVALREKQYGRPQAFESTDKSHTILTVLKRVRKEKQSADDGKKHQAAEKPARTIINTAGVHELCDGKWKVEVLSPGPGGDAEKDKALKDMVRLTVTYTPNRKCIAFNQTFSKNGPWFVMASSPDVLLCYNGDREMHLITLSSQGTLESETTYLPKKWVALLAKQRPQPVLMIQETGPDGKVRVRPARPTGPVGPYPGRKEGEVVPPPGE